MKKVIKFRKEIKLPAIKLYLDDLEEIEKIIKDEFKLNNQEELIINFIVGEYEYNVQELKDCKQKEINNLEIRVYRKEKKEEVEFDLDCITEITVILRKTNTKIEFQNDIEIRGVVSIIEKYLSEKKKRIVDCIINSSIITLEYKKENSFLKRNSDKLKVGVFNNIVSFVLGILSAILLYHFGILKCQL